MSLIRASLLTKSRSALANQRRVKGRGGPPDRGGGLQAGGDSLESSSAG